MKRRNEEAECTTEPDRFASNPPKKTLAFWGGVHVRIYAWGGPEESVPTEEGGTATYKPLYNSVISAPAPIP